MAVDRAVGGRSAETGDAALVLASASPRRKQLLSALGVAFETAPTDIEERVVLGESPWRCARRLACGKLRVAAGVGEGKVVLAADTVVDLDGSVLGKPTSDAAAVRMLRSLRGRSHSVHTAIAVSSAGKFSLGVCTTLVGMRAYSDAEIEEYIASGEHRDKAGAYAIQNRVLRPVREFSGSFSNVMGLPLGLTSALLREAGLNIEGSVADLEHDLARELEGSCTAGAL